MRVGEFCPDCEGPEPTKEDIPELVLRVEKELEDAA